MPSHPGWEQLNDALDGRLPDAEGEAMRVHLATCAECRDTAARLRALGDAARHLPATIAPPAALWRDVSASIAAGDRARYAFSPRALAAAALLLVAVTSGVTAYVLRPGKTAPLPVAARGAEAPTTAPASAGATRPLPSSFTATEAAYLHDLAELHATFVAQRHALSPATVAVVDRSLRAIDTAIAEARSALLADPANQALAELLSATYRQKVELLRRAAEYSAS